MLHLATALIPTPPPAAPPPPAGPTVRVSLTTGRHGGLTARHPIARLEATYPGGERHCVQAVMHGHGAWLEGRMRRQLALHRP